MTVIFNDPAELYGNSEATASITLAAICSVCAFWHTVMPSCTRADVCGTPWNVFISCTTGYH